jgi:hypothetical protein
MHRGGILPSECRLSRQWDSKTPDALVFCDIGTCRLCYNDFSIVRDLPKRKVILYHYAP